MRQALRAAAAWRGLGVAAAAALALAAPVLCADTPPLLQPVAGDGEAPPPPWRVVGLPDQHKPYTRFTVVPLDGERVLKVEAASSYGMLVHPLGPPPAAPLQLHWRWRLDEPNPASDLHSRAGDDSPAKVCVLFDLPLQAVPFVERQWLRLARLRSHDPLPAATVCYVWDAHLAAGTTLPNAFTRRIRFVVVEGADAPLHRWLDERRDVQADFLQLFGDEAHALPPLVGIAVGADADNTRAHSVAHVASIGLELSGR